MSTPEWNRQREEKDRLAFMKIRMAIAQVPEVDKLDLDYEDEWSRGFKTGEAEFARKLRKILEGE